MMDRPQAQLDEQFMGMALREAGAAADDGDVPVGAVIVHEGQVIARGRNQRELLQDPTAHAEILAITAAAEYVASWRLTGCTLYVTLEPCVMCAGAIVNARIDRVVYGASDPKAGACESLYEVLGDDRLNHRPVVMAGVRAGESSDLLRGFFQVQRALGKK